MRDARGKSGLCLQRLTSSTLENSSSHADWVEASHLGWKMFGLNCPTSQVTCCMVSFTVRHILVLRLNVFHSCTPRPRKSSPRRQQPIPNNTYQLAGLAGRKSGVTRSSLDDIYKSCQIGVLPKCQLSNKPPCRSISKLYLSYLVCVM